MTTVTAAVFIEGGEVVLARKADTSARCWVQIDGKLTIHSTTRADLLRVLSQAHEAVAALAEGAEVGT
jgi:hypothetical protein